MKSHPIAGLARWGVHPLLLGFVLFPTLVLARGKEYPAQGTVIALGTSQEPTGGGEPGSFTPIHRTYTVRTPTRVFVLECPHWMNGFHVHSPSECGGKKKIEIGDAIRFRIEKNHACVSTAEGKEEKLRVVSEGMNEAGNKVPSASQQP